MADGLFSDKDEGTLYFSRSDPSQGFGAWSDHPFVLEDREWPTVEHYYQAMKFEDPEYQNRIRQAKTPKQARKLGRSRFKKRRNDWTRLKTVYMTRALYTKCKTWSDIATELLDTGDCRLVENSLYDYYWGCGRDRRGENRYGQVLMNVRSKLREEMRAG